MPQWPSSTASEPVHPSGGRSFHGREVVSTTTAANVGAHHSEWMLAMSTAAPITPAQATRTRRLAGRATTAPTHSTTHANAVTAHIGPFPRMPLHSSVHPSTEHSSRCHAPEWAQASATTIAPTPNVA